LDIGCHLTLVGEPPFPRTMFELLGALAWKRIRVYDELAAQVRRIGEAGLTLTHLDTHKHTHFFPTVLEAVVQISADFRIPWVRRPFDFPLRTGGIGWKTRAANRALAMARGRFERVLRRRSCRFTDHFAGFRLTGNFDAASLAVLIRALPEGSTEFMCHPGHCRAELRAAGTRLKESREEELRALTAPEVREALAEASVKLVSFREL
jgi:chitin disaccharide deacetylase